MITKTVIKRTYQPIIAQARGGRKRYWEEGRKRRILLTFTPWTVTNANWRDFEDIKLMSPSLTVNAVIDPGRVGANHLLTSCLLVLVTMLLMSSFHHHLQSCHYYRIFLMLFFLPISTPVLRVKPPSCIWTGVCTNDVYKTFISFWPILVRIHLTISCCYCCWISY